MPTIALTTFDQRFAIARPPAPSLVSSRLQLPVELDGFRFPATPYIFLDPGLPFSVVSHSVAAVIPCAPVGIHHDPIPFEQWDPVTFSMQPAGTMSARRFTSWQRVACDLVTTTFQFRVTTSGHMTAPLSVLAHRPVSPMPNFGDFFIILGYSFLRDNSAGVTIAPLGSTVGRLTVR
jgi:hypothetical protein